MVPRGGIALKNEPLHVFQAAPISPPAGESPGSNTSVHTLKSIVPRMTILDRLRDLPVGRAATAAVLMVLLGFAVSVDFPRASLGFKGDEATYYSLTRSLARDFDFTYQRQDLVRVWEEFPGPEGIFLKRGSRVDFERSSSFPFVRMIRTEDPARGRLYFAKSYIYPLFAAPFVLVFGTNGFLIFHALLLAACYGAAYSSSRRAARVPRWRPHLPRCSCSRPSSRSTSCG